MCLVVPSAKMAKHILRRCLLFETSIVKTCFTMRYPNAELSSHSYAQARSTKRALFYLSLRQQRNPSTHFQLSLVSFSEYLIPAIS